MTDTSRPIIYDAVKDRTIVPISTDDYWFCLQEGIRPDDLIAASDMYRNMSTHYIRNEEALRSMGWHGAADNGKALADEERQRFIDAGLPVPKFYESRPPG